MPSRIVYKVLNPKEDDPTYRYVAVGPGGEVPLYGDGDDLLSASRIWPTTRNEHYGDPESMEILFVPKIPTQDELNRTWPGTQEKMHLRVYGHSTHADAIRYTDPDAMVAAPRFSRKQHNPPDTRGSDVSASDVARHAQMNRMKSAGTLSRCRIHSVAVCSLKLRKPLYALNTPPVSCQVHRTSAKRVRVTSQPR